MSGQKLLALQIKKQYEMKPKNTLGNSASKKTPINSVQKPDKI